jgi:SAM-dependent methyltransferase
VLDLGSGSGEMLCTWARDHGVMGTGIDMSRLFTEQAKLRAEKLGVAGQVKFIHGDAAGFVSDEKAEVAACLGATWIGGAETALRLARYFDTTPQFWLGLQADYDLNVAADELGERLDHEIRVHALAV